MIDTTLSKMSNTKKKIVITGATGFIGLNLVKTLADMGEDVTAISHTKRDFYYDQDKWLHKVRFGQFDLTKPENCEAIFSHGCDYLIVSNAVSFGAKFIQNNPLALINANTIMNVNLLDAAARNGVKKVVYYGSTTGYPDTELPVKEEDMFTGDPFDKYFSVGWMKRYAEVLMRLYAEKLKKMTCVSLRLSNVYGRYDKFNPETSHVLPALIRKFAEKQNPLEVWGNGEESRDLIHVGDVVRATVLALEKVEGFEAINIGAGDTWTVNNLIDKLSVISDFNPDKKYLPNNSQMIKVRKVDVSKAEKLLGFKPEININYGIAETLKWYQDNKENIYR